MRLCWWGWLFTLGPLALWAADAANTRTTAADLCRDANRALPPGTPKPEVFAWLRARGYWTGDDPAGQCCGDPVRRYGVGLTKHYSDDFVPFFPTHVWYQVGFDEHDRLAGPITAFERATTL